MTLAIMLMTSHGVWASTDHRLTTHPDGRLVADNSVKHVVIKCPDGSALIAYTGLGRVGRIDVSAWMRGVLRGETRTVDETLIDLREQATARLGLQAKALNVPHVFLVGAYLSGRPWAVEIRNFQAPTAISPGGIQATFETSAAEAASPMLLVGGAGAAAVNASDRELLAKISQRKPRKPEDYMRLLGEINQRAASGVGAAARTVSSSSTVVFMPPSGEGVKIEWHGPEAERHLAPPGMSHIFHGLDFSEMTKTLKSLQDLSDGKITQEEFDRIQEESLQRMVRSEGRR